MDIDEALTPQEIQQYKEQYNCTDKDLQDVVDELDTDKKGITTPSTNIDPRVNASHTLFSRQFSETLIHFQLELDSILELIEHTLKGDILKFKDGHKIWESPENEDERVFNDYGTKEIMRILAMYINRNTILSNYSEDQINMKMLDLGKEVADLIFMKYEKFGLDTLEKRKLYPIIVREITDIVHSSYLRAYGAGERDSLREARQVIQTQPITNVGYPGMPQRQRSPLNPKRWVVGKNY